MISLDIVSSELAGEQEKGSFSTHPVLDSKPTRSLSIQGHINLDKVKKVQIMRPMSIKDHIDLDKMNKVKTIRPVLILAHSIKSTKSFPGPESLILDHIHFYEANKFNTCEKPVNEVCICDDFP